MNETTLSTTITSQTLTNSDGVPVPLVHVAPQTPKAIALVLPALGVAASYYAKCAHWLAERGIAAGVLEIRGQGESPIRAGRNVDFGYETLLDDLSTAVKALRKGHPGLRLVLVGHSLGGHLAVLQLALERQSVDAVVLVATATPHQAPYPGLSRWKVGVGTRLIGFVSALLGYYPGHRLGFGGLQPKTLMREWAAMGRTGRYVVEGNAVDIEATLERVRIPVLALRIDGDSLAPEGPCDAVLAKLPNAALQSLAVGAPTLSERGRHHQRWAREPAAVMDPVRRFIDDLDQAVFVGSAAAAPTRNGLAT